MMPVFFRGDRVSDTMNRGLRSRGELAGCAFSGSEGRTSPYDSFPLLDRVGRMVFLGEVDRRAPEISIRCPTDMLRATRSCGDIHGDVSRGVPSFGVAEPGVCEPDGGSLLGELAWDDGTSTLRGDLDASRGCGLG